MVVGLGFVGLACARWLSTSGMSTTVRMLNVYLAKMQTQEIERLFTQVSTKNKSHEKLNCISKVETWDINHSQIGRWIVESHKYMLSMLFQTSL